MTRIPLRVVPLVEDVAPWVVHIDAKCLVAHGVATALDLIPLLRASWPEDGVKTHHVRMYADRSGREPIWHVQVARRGDEDGSYTPLEDVHVYASLCEDEVPQGLTVPPMVSLPHGVQWAHFWKAMLLSEMVFWTMEGSQLTEWLTNEEMEDELGLRRFARLHADHDHDRETLRTIHKHVIPAEGGHSTVLLHAESEAAAYFAFQGSQGLRDWESNLTYTPVPGDELGIPGHVHSGYLARIRPVSATLATALQRARAAGKLIVFTGHSAGAALAHIKAVQELMREPSQRERVVCIGFAGPSALALPPAGAGHAPSVTERLITVVKAGDLVPLVLHPAMVPRLGAVLAGAGWSVAATLRWLVGGLAGGVVHDVARGLCDRHIGAVTEAAGATGFCHHGRVWFLQEDVLVELGGDVQAAMMEHVARHTDVHVAQAVEHDMVTKYACSLSANLRA